MSFGGGGDLSQKLWFEFQEVGGDVADDVARKFQQIEGAARATFEQFQEGSITGVQLLGTLNQLSDSKAVLLKISKDLIAQLNAEAQAEKEMAAVRASLADKAASDARERMEEFVRVEKEKVQAAQANIQAEADMAAVRASLADKAARDAEGKLQEFLRVEQDKRIAVETTIQAEKDLAAIRSNLAAKAEADSRAEMEDRLRNLNAESAAEQARYQKWLETNQNYNTGAEQRAAITRQATETQAQAERDLAAIRDNLAGKAEKDGEEAARLAQQKVADAKRATDAIKAEVDAWAAGFTAVNKAADAKANLARVSERMASATMEQVQAEKELARAQAYYADGTAIFDRVAQARVRVAKADREAAEAAKELGVAQNHVTTAMAPVPEAVNRAGRSMDAGKDKATSLTRALFLTSQGIQDAEYGFSAVVNNIPLAFVEWGRTFGISTDLAYKLGAGAAVAATALNVMSPAISMMWKAFNTSDGIKAIESIDKVKTELDYLRMQSWVINVDPRLIEEAEEKLARLKRAKDAANRADTAQTEEQQEAGKRVMHAMVESAGGTDEASGKKNLKDSIAALQAAHPERFGDQLAIQENEENKKRLQKFQESFDKATDPNHMQAISAQMNSLQGQINKFEAARSAQLDLMFGKALLGNESQIKKLQEIIAVDPQFMANRGIGQQFNTEIQQSRRDVVTQDIAEGNMDAPWKKKQDKAKEAIKENKKKDADKDKKIEKFYEDISDELSRDMSNFFAKTMSHGGRPGPAAVKEQLDKLDRPEIDDTVIGRVTNKGIKNYKDQLAKEALQGGTSIEEAEGAIRKRIADQEVLKANKGEATDMAVEGLSPREKAQRAQQKADFEDAEADWNQGKRDATQRQNRDQGNASSLAGKTSLDEEAGLYLNEQAARRASLGGLSRTERARAIREAKRAGNPFMSEQDAKQAAEDEIMRKLSTTGATDKDGKPLDAGQRRGAAKAMVGDVQADINRQTLSLNERQLGMNDKFLAVANEFMARLQRQENRLRAQNQQVNTFRPTELQPGVN